ncbi:ROK family protein [Bifidobacterium callimiconis]|nr:ROK family protein [Bifidobacterium callimiconis]
MTSMHDDRAGLDVPACDRRYLAFDIGGTKIASGVVSLPPADSLATPLVEDVTEIPTLADRGGDDVRERLVEFAARRLEQCVEAGVDIAGVGIGSAGVVDSGTGVILSATDLMPGWAGQHIAAAVGEATGLPVHMVGDVGAHGLGEATYGAGREYPTMLSVGVGTGIGGAYVDHGRLITGAHGVAGHVGHMPHGLGAGMRCSCGTTCGHIEPVASGTGIADLFESRRPDDVPPATNAAEISRRAAAGEAYATEILSMSARALGECLAGMGSLIDPAVIVLSGSVVNAGEVWWKALREGFADGALPRVRTTPLLRGQLGGNAPLIGAAVGFVTAQ